MFRKIRPNNLDKINRLQSMKKHPIGGIGERDSRINRLINNKYNPQFYYVNIVDLTYNLNIILMNLFFLPII